MTLTFIAHVNRFFWPIISGLTAQITYIVRARRERAFYFTPGALSGVGWLRWHPIQRMQSPKIQSKSKMLD
jgi:hypothetical protein